ncbi:NAD(P)/FAD-dependent oxidoreductase [Candidatus Sumerlaeota bacterium]|nr:NAD(P)/FAD-dependent oxidoreductase [Candidatus Sumerlaeota bacterium]
MNWDVIIIGGGAAGMMAAATAAQRGKKVLVLERNEKPGKKLFISGKGRCNITNDADIKTFQDHIPRNPKFLYSAFHALSNKELMDFFEKRGVPLKVERGGRVFPASDKSSDIIKVFVQEMKEHDVEIRFNERAREIIVKQNRIEGVRTFQGNEYSCDKLILATGGLSYPMTGSTGDGFDMARKLGHHVTDMEPSLVPIEIKEKWVKDLQGLSLKNVSLAILHQEKKVYEDMGEMLFAHFGVSGPLVLTLSSYIKDYLKQKKETLLSLDLKPALSSDVLDKRIQRDFALYSKRELKNAFFDLLPRRMIPVIVSLSGMDGDKYVHQITKEERKNLITILKNCRMTVKGLRPIDEAIVTSGGVSTKEINPSTMESKLVKGLYFAGEIIDIEGLTGGYNLQIAFSTGFLAGKSV